MANGIVKWFNSAKGYGFICAQSGGQDVFAHFSAIVMDGYKCLKAGQNVTFEVNEGPKGLHASNIRPEEEGEVRTRTPQHEMEEA
jgi:cold shock protein